MGAKNIYDNNMDDGDDVERGLKKTVLFNIETSHSCVAILVSLTSAINKKLIAPPLKASYMPMKFY